ncbi:pectinesterase family protein [Cloacibacterium sp.]|uniref:pectinesterase family protein n=1 Tax=Cloacibacterium sp. TaxID=1913682 RepID=UPI0039E4384E
MISRILILFYLLICANFFSQEKDTIIVSKNDKGDFTSIQEAINQSKAFPYKRLVIFIKNGIYNEKVKINEWNTNLSIIGEEKDKTIITFDDYFDKINKGRNSTFSTSTLSIEANDTVLKNLTIENVSGDIGQAIALSITATRVSVINCKILGNQDTLYLSGEGKQFLKNCYIEGTTDFIFGNATSYFENCKIHSKKDSYITAASTPENAEFGFVFKDCKITAEKKLSKIYLGRPWRIFAKTAFINCNFEANILPEGWHNWDKQVAEKHSYFAEFKNYGKGSSNQKRVKWSYQLSNKEVKKYNKNNILKDYKKINWYEIF